MSGLVARLCFLGMAASLCAVNAHADDTAGVPLPGDARTELDAAIQAFLDGDTADAKTRLQGLLARGPELDAPIRRDALAYLGDILLTEDGPSAARNVLEALLDEDAGYRMDPIKHPPEVCAFFEDLRLSRIPVAPPPTRIEPAKPRPFPYLALLPGGVYYYTDRKPVTGVIVGGLQVGALVTNVVLYSQIQNHALVPRDDPEAEAEFNRLVVGADVAAAAAWLSWIVPATIEVGRWATPTRVQVGVGPGSVVLTGQF